MEKADLSNATEMIDEVLENSSNGIDKVKKAVFALSLIICRKSGLLSVLADIALSI